MKKALQEIFNALNTLRSATAFAGTSFSLKIACDHSHDGHHAGDNSFHVAMCVYAVMGMTPISFILQIIIYELINLQCEAGQLIRGAAPRHTRFRGKPWYMQTPKILTITKSQGSAELMQFKHDTETCLFVDFPQNFALTR